MWIFYETCYYFDYNDVEVKTSEHPLINETIFTDKTKLIRFLNFHYCIDDDLQYKIETEKIPTVPGECKKLFVRMHETKEEEYRQVSLSHPFGVYDNLRLSK